MGRFFSKKVELPNGDVFDSQIEYAYWCKLLKDQEQGLIFNLKRQEKHLIQEAFRDKNGTAIRKIEYLSDMCYTDKNGEFHIVDCKGAEILIEETFKIKFKLLKFRYPEYNYHIILKDKHTKEFVDIEDKVAKKAMKDRDKAIPKKSKKSKVKK